MQPTYEQAVDSLIKYWIDHLDITDNKVDETCSTPKERSEVLKKIIEEEPVQEESSRIFLFRTSAKHFLLSLKDSSPEKRGFYTIENEPCSYLRKICISSYIPFESLPKNLSTYISADNEFIAHSME